MTAGCAKRAFRFGGQQLGGLMNYERDNKLKSYNEVLISSPVYGRNAPESVAAVVFGLMGQGLPAGCSVRRPNVHSADGPI